MRNDLREHRRSVDSPSMRLCVRLSNCLRHDDLRRNTNAGRDGSAAEVEKGRNEGIAGLRMSEIRFPSLSSMRDIFRFSAFWLAFGLLVGPVVGFLLGARSWRDLWISVQAALLFTLPLSVMIAATRLIPPRWIGKRPVDNLRGFVSDVAIRLAITVIAALVGAGLVDALLVPGFLRSAHGMGSILIYMVVGASLFMAIDYAAGYRRSYRARLRSEEQYKARVEGGMRMAAAIQRGLLPRALPDGGPLLIAG